MSNNPSVAVGFWFLITTKNHLVGCARDNGLYSVQRLFIIDSAALSTALDSVNSSKPDFAEVMPGAYKKVVEKFVNSSTIPVIAGGLIEDKADVINVLSVGATAVSTTGQTLWDL